MPPSRRQNQSLLLGGLALLLSAGAASALRLQDAGGGSPAADSVALARRLEEFEERKPSRRKLERMHPCTERIVPSSAGVIPLLTPRGYF